MRREALSGFARALRSAAAIACAAVLAGCAQPPARPPPREATAVIEANRRAEAYFRNGDLSNAARYYLEALRLARSIEDADAIAANAINLSIVYQRAGRYDDARASLALVLEPDGKPPFSRERLAQAALRRAILDADQRQFSSAGDWVGRAEDYCGRCPLLAAIHNVRAQLALEAGRLDEATANAQAALSAARGAGDRAETGNALRLLGMTALARGDAAAAPGFLEQALDIDRELAEPRKIYLDLVGLGRTKALGGDRNAARSYYERALAVSEADRDARSAGEARALIEASGGKRDSGVAGAAPAKVESHAGQ